GGGAGGGRGRGFDQQAPPLTRGAVEARKHQVQIHGERIHRHHFAQVRAREGAKPAAQVLVIRHPGPARLLVSLDGALRPLVELLVDELAGREWLQPERMAAQVHKRHAALVDRQREALAQAPQRIRAIARARLRERRGVRAAAHELTEYTSGRLGTASPASAGTCSSRRYAPSCSSSGTKASSVMVASG